MARVLVVDDDPALLRALRVALNAAGHQLSTAPDGEQGLAQAVRSSPEVIVLDLGLPDIDGLEVCRRIRTWSDVPIIVGNAGRVCTHQMILTAVWGTGYSREAQYLHAYVHRIRQKLGNLGGPYIKTAPGIGYLLADPSTDVKAGPEGTGP
jgi:DNA-binding response OmpR family regulator